MIQVPCRSPGRVTPWVCGPAGCPAQLGFDSDRLAVGLGPATGKSKAARRNRVPRRRHTTRPPGNRARASPPNIPRARLVLRALCRANRWGARAFWQSRNVWGRSAGRNACVRCDRLGRLGEHRIAGLCRDGGMVEWLPQLDGRLQDRPRRHLPAGPGCRLRQLLGAAGVRGQCNGREDGARPGAGPAIGRTNAASAMRIVGTNLATGGSRCLD